MKEDKAVVKYWRYNSVNTQGFDTLEEAYEFIRYEEDYGNISAESLTYGDKVWKDPYGNAELDKMFPRHKRD